MTRHDLNCAHGAVSISIAFLAADNSVDAVQVDLSVSFLPTDERLGMGSRPRLGGGRGTAGVLQRGGTPVRARPLVDARRGSGRAALIEMGPASAPADGAAEACFVRLSTPPGLKDAIGRAFRDYAKWW